MKAMKSHKIAMTIGLLVSLVLNAHGQSPEKKNPVKISGFTQATMSKTENNDAFVFGFDRVRLMAKGDLNEFASYKLNVDFNKQATDKDKDGDSPGIIKDALVIFKPGRKVQVSVGKFKTPIGMEFNASGMKLDIIKRGLGQKLVFERNVGAMIHAKKLTPSGLGVAFGVFNAGPNGANDVGDAASGQDYTLTGRLNLDHSKKLHAEAFWGSALTSVSGQDAVNIFGLGAASNVTKELQFKGEFMSRDDAQNPNSDGTDFYLQGGYLIHPQIQPVVKFERFDVKEESRDQSDVTLGVNFFLNPKKHHEARIQINYIVSDLDGKDALHLMFQGAF